MKTTVYRASSTAADGIKGRVGWEVEEGGGGGVKSKDAAGLRGLWRGTQSWHTAQRECLQKLFKTGLKILFARPNYDSFERPPLLLAAGGWLTDALSASNFTRVTSAATTRRAALPPIFRSKPVPSVLPSHTHPPPHASSRPGSRRQSVPTAATVHKFCQPQPHWLAEHIAINRVRKKVRKWRKDLIFTLILVICLLSVSIFCFHV